MDLTRLAPQPPERDLQVASAWLFRQCDFFNQLHKRRWSGIHAVLPVFAVNVQAFDIVLRIKNDFTRMNANW